MHSTTPTHHDRALDEIYARLQQQLTTLGQHLEAHQRGQIPCAESHARMRQVCRTLHEATTDFDRRISRQV
ncbi:hypothetical protein [Streptosporangium saharense]|uniref:Uncharacterized protein n=1 Tax=Streptosporangium saharense TaxID=1706840 RepID=A0A7W7VSQ1_9ACTN|nr:hypothetical protein [Streptosporangium saharense]MBB4920968.1 hypothetical protein [Streptosporangium saharense]